jgi:hypothetical protein
MPTDTPANPFKLYELTFESNKPQDVTLVNPLPL